MSSLSAVTVVWLLLINLSSLCDLVAAATGATDRLQVVSQYNVRLNGQQERGLLQVGNGNFAFNVDVTGTQSIKPYNTLSTWGWHESEASRNGEGSGRREQRRWSGRKQAPMAEGSQIDGSWQDGMTAPESIARLDDKDGDDAPQRERPTIKRRMNLARIGLLWNGKEIRNDTLDGSAQTLNLATGIITSNFNMGVDATDVETLVSPSLDAVALRVQSEGLKRGNLTVFIDLPYPSSKPGSSGEYIGDFTRPGDHKSSFAIWGPRVEIKHEVDNTTYFVNVQWESGAPMSKFRRMSPNGHRYFFDIEDASSAEFVFHFTPGSPAFTPGFAALKRESTYWWQEFWNRGAFVDCTASEDPQAKELQRRAILSQYYLAINAAGSSFVPDSGLVNEEQSDVTEQYLAWSLYAHWQSWGKWDRVGGILPAAYKELLATTTGRAFDGRRSANQALSVHYLPDPFYFAEQEYKAAPTLQTLQKWQKVLDDTAAEMVAMALLNETSRQYEIPSSSGKDRVFDWAYWRFGFATMMRWAERQNLYPSRGATIIYRKLAPSPVSQTRDIYTSSENSSQPSFAVLDSFGMLPQNPPLNSSTIRRTIASLRKMGRRNDSGQSLSLTRIAMAAIRSGDSSEGVNLLLEQQLPFDKAGTISFQPAHKIRFSASGELLMAMALMANGWTNSTGSHWPQSWNCAAEQFSPGI